MNTILPKTRDELLALPIVELPEKYQYCGLPLLKPEGSCYSAKDDDGEWWALEFGPDDTYGRRKGGPF